LRNGFVGAASYYRLDVRRNHGLPGLSEADFGERDI